MSEKFFLQLNCKYCTQLNSVDYLSFQEHSDFTCNNKDCKELNFLTAEFEVKKTEDVTEEDVVQAFEMIASANTKLDKIKKDAKEYLKNIQKRAKHGK